MWKEAVQQWYQHYQAAQAPPYGAAAPQDAEYSKEQPQVQLAASFRHFPHMSVVEPSETVGKGGDFCLPLGSERPDLRGSSECGYWTFTLVVKVHLVRKNLNRVQPVTVLFKVR